MLYHDIELSVEEIYAKPRNVCQLRNDLQNVIPDQKSDRYLTLTSYYMDTDVCFSGRLAAAPYRPISSATKQNLVYIMNFFLLEMDENYYTRRQNLELFELRYTLEGKGFLSYDGKEYILTPGMGYLIDNRKPHYYRTEGTYWKSTVMHIDGPFIRNMYPLFLKRGNVIFTEHTVKDFEQKQYQILKIDTSITSYREYRVSAMLTSLLTDLLTAADEKDKMMEAQTSILVKKVLTYLSEHYAEDIKMQALSETLFVSREHLSREFKKYMSMSPKDYLNKLRIYHAERLLRTTDLSIGEIAEKIGYASESCFFRAFKNENNIAPGQYRKKNTHI
ncbi:helix-turn-helix domain-containing protein [Ruminococcus sp. 5_1_39BFAA]|uniref:helix-turn-helix domain-containing protein n=1 Tax=Ruminococcus sp. 5_1_39BFAA TaxID=457412 RepID=UPI003561AF38